MTRSGRSLLDVLEEIEDEAVGGNLLVGGFLSSPELRASVALAVEAERRLFENEAMYGSAYGPYLHDSAYAEMSWPTLVSIARQTLRNESRTTRAIARLKLTFGRTR